MIRCLRVIKKNNHKIIQKQEKQVHKLNKFLHNMDLKFCKEIEMLKTQQWEISGTKNLVKVRQKKGIYELKEIALKMSDKNKKKLKNWK